MLSAPILLIMIRRGMGPTPIAHIAGAVLVVPVLMGSLVTSGELKASTLGLVSAPVFVMLLAGTRSSWLWCMFAMLGFGLLGLRVSGSSAEWLLGLALTTIGLTAIAHVFEVLRRRTEDELIHARDEAKAAVEIKARFLANMSHEIRTPMNGVLGMLGLLLDTRLDTIQRDYAQTAHASGLSLLDLLNDVLDFSKMEAGQMTLEADCFDLRALVEDVLDQVAVLADPKGLALVSRYVPGTPHRVYGDHGRIRQVLVNLIGNAVKFTKEGHVLVTVEHEPRPEGPPLFSLSVQDTGIGISTAGQVTVFEQFQRGDMSTTNTYAGTGLGLTIVRELVDLMNGELSMTSEHGRGSTFTFSIPLPVDVTTPEDEPMLHADLQGQRVLVVDDHQVDRFVLHEVLTEWGFGPVACASGAEALTELRSAADQGDPFGLALLDYHMPRMDGLELTRRIKEDPQLRGTVLVMMSSVTKQLEAKALQASGCAAYLVKPVHQSTLMSAIVSAWSGRSGVDAPVTPAPDREAAPSEVVEGSDIRVLVAEDNLINQKVARRMLADLGCRVDVASNGREALDLIEATPYTVVFMDVQMPEMDGLQATAAVRDREAGSDRHLFIVAMTAHAMPTDRQRCLDAGMDSYISKPVRRRDLLQAMREHLPPPDDAVSRAHDAMALSGIDTSVPCDIQWLRDNYDADDAVVHSLVEMFLDRATELIAQMKIAVEAGDMATLRRHAHALKGISGTVGANQLFALLSDDPSVVAESMEPIERAFAVLGEFFADKLGIGHT